MNKTKHGRWGRYKVIGGVEHKLCNGPLHSKEGAWLPLRAFWLMKKGPRAGKPMSRCTACERAYRGRGPNSGLVPVDTVYFIFRELEARIGRAETCRRLGVSQNLWMRLERRVYKHMYKETARRAILLLRELRQQGTVRHKDSIKHGSIARGHKEKPITHVRDYYISHGDADIERTRRYRGKEA